MNPIPEKDSNRFNLHGKTALITGGGGLLGPEHAIGLAKWGATVLLLDIDNEGLHRAKERVLGKLPECNVKTAIVDITNESALIEFNEQLKSEGLVVDVLVNNAAINPKMDSDDDTIVTGTVENYDMELWDKEIAVSITGNFICCKIFGSTMADLGGGSIINIASDLAIQAPDQRVYSSTGKIEDVKHFKPIGYSVVKSAMLGLNRYLASYWAHRGVRVNCLIPGAVKATQSRDLMKNISYRVPLGRLAQRNEYQEAVVFLASDASSYMTGHEIIIDGGRSIW